MIVENTKQDQIKNLIIKVANSTYGITQEHIRKAVERYIYDDRDIEVIEQELWALSHQIEKEARLQEERRKRVNENNQPNVNREHQNAHQQTIFDTTSTDNQEPQESQTEPEKDVNLQESTQVDNASELSAMFSDAPKVEQKNNSYQQQAEKGRVLVKTPTSNNRGQATFLNLCFIFSTIAILGMLISTIIIRIQQ